MTDRDQTLSEVQTEIQRAEERGERDHRRAPLLDALAAFHRSDVVPFQIPAHKGGGGVTDELLSVLGIEPFLADAPVSKGLDDRRGTRQILQHAQSLVADAFGSEQAFFSTNGSTLSMELAVLTAVQPGEQILVERNIHKSVVSGIVTSGARPVWAVPELDEGNAMSHCVTADAVRAALDRDPGIRAALIVSPTYFGAAADVRGIADACHEHGIPLVVDDAWGALFRFHPDLPEDPIGAGADLVISSFHKSIPAIMQCSVMNVQGDRIDRDRLSLCLDSMESTSASALLLASMDGARQQVVLHGEELLGRTLALADRAADEIGRLPGLRVLGPEIIDGRGVVGFDRTKVTIDLTDLGVDGYEAADWLYEECGVAAELDDYRHLMFLVTLGDDDASIDRLIDGLRRLAEHGAGRSPLPPMAWAGQLLRGAEYVADVRTAFLGPVEQVPITESIGRLAAEPISPYPPGVPVLIPGQRITAEIVDHLRAGLERGMLIKGVTDPKLERVRVVAGS